MNSETESAADLPPSDLGYAQALSELESIVGGMEQGQVDIDQLTSRMKRATELVGYCRERLNSVQSQVEEMSLDD